MRYDAKDYKEDDWRYHLQQINVHRKNMQHEVSACEKLCDHLSMFTKMTLEKIETQEEIINEKFSYFASTFGEVSLVILKREFFSSFGHHTHVPFFGRKAFSLKHCFHLILDFIEFIQVE